MAKKKKKNSGEPIHYHEVRVINPGNRKIKIPAQRNPPVLVVERHGTNRRWYVRDEKTGELVGSPNGHKTEAAANKELDKILTKGSSRYLQNPATNRYGGKQYSDAEWVQRSNPSVDPGLRQAASRLARGEHQ